MKRFLSLKFVLLALFALVAGNVSAEEVITYEKVTDASSLAAGDVIAIAYDNGASSAALSTTQNNNNRSATTVTISNGVLTITDDVALITLESADGGWYLHTTNGDNTGYLSATNSTKKNYMHTETTANAYCIFTIAISGGNATITCTGKTSRNLLQYNTSGGIYACYNSGQNTPQIYRKTVTNTGDAGKETATAKWSDADGNEVTTLTVKEAEWESATFPTFSHTGDAETVTYTSSNEEVATIAADGTITVKGTGTTTIKGHVDETDNYNSASASYELTVVGDNAFVRATSIIPGKTYALIASTSSGARALTTQSGSNSYGGYTESVSISGTTAAVNDEAAKLKILLVPGYTDRYVLQLSDGKYAYYTGSSNSLNFTSDSATANKNYWTITLGDDTDQLVPSNSTGYHLQYNASSPRFACYSSSQVTPALYMLASDEYVDVTITSAKYATLYYGTMNLEVPEGVTAKIISDVTNGEANNTNYAAGSVIGAGAAVILYTDAPDDYQFKIVAAGSSPIAADGFLFGADKETTANAEGYKYYILAQDKNASGEDVIGFYWQSGTSGKSVTVGAHKAYLRLDSTTAAGVRAIVLDGPATTGIDELSTVNCQPSTVFDLQGRKLSKLQKGINIVGGKTVIVR